MNVREQGINDSIFPNMLVRTSRDLDKNTASYDIRCVRGRMWSIKLCLKPGLNVNLQIYKYILESEKSM